MSKILFYTDTHFGNTGDFSHPSNSGYSTRLDYTIALHEWIINLIDEHSPDIIVNGGDLYKSQGSIEAKAISACTTSMTNFARRCSLEIPHYVLLGNHDFISTDRSICSIDWLEKLPPFQLIKQTEVIECDGFSMVLAPYFLHDEEAYESVAQALKRCEQNTKLFFGHLTIHGVIDSVSRTPTGFSPFKLEHGSSKKVVDTSFLSKNFTFAFNGHHHVPQRPFTNVILPGSLQQFTVTEFDYDLRRGVWLIDTEKKTTELIPNYISPRIVKAFSLSDIDSLEDNCCVIYNHIHKNEDKATIQKALERFVASRILSSSGLVTKEESDKTVGLQLDVEAISFEETFGTYMDNVFTGQENVKNLGLKLLTQAKQLL